MEDLGAAVERIMADPAFSRMVKELGGGDSGDLMEKLPQVMETLGPILGGDNADKTADPPPEKKEEDRKAENPLPQISAVVGKRPYSRTNAEKLFIALRPYLGDRRREMVDRCVQVMQMGDLLRAAGAAAGLNGSGPAKNAGEGER